MPKIKFSSFILFFFIIFDTISATEIDIQSKLLEESNSDTCDVLYFIGGVVVEAKVLEITESEIKYKNCNYLSGPTITVNKNKVYKINYANGSNELIYSESDKYESFATIGFISSIVGLFIFGIPMGIISIITGKVALFKINKNKRKGKGLAIAAIIIGFIDLIGVILLLSIS